MDRGTFDALMRQTLKDQAEKVSMPEARKQQIYEAVAECRKVPACQTQPDGQAGACCRKEEHSMKKSGKWKVLPVAAALCILGTMAVMAAGKIVGYSSSHDVNQPDFATYADMARADEAAGFAVKVPEKFDNGFSFDRGFLIEEKAHDENGEIVDTFPVVSVFYKKGGESLTLDIKQVRPEWSETTTGNPRSIQYGDKTLVYSEDHYRFVPPDYQITEEEQKAVEAGELYVSYGSSQVEDSIVCFLQWTEGDVQYILLGDGSRGLGMDGMVEAGKQIIDSQEL